MSSENGFVCLFVACLFCACLFKGEGEGPNSPNARGFLFSKRPLVKDRRCRNVTRLRLSELLELHHGKTCRGYPVAFGGGSALVGGVQTCGAHTLSGCVGFALKRRSETLERPVNSAGGMQAPLPCF